MADLSSVQLARRKLRLFSWSGAFFVAGILAALNFIASYIPLRFDSSQGRVYSITRGSKDILKKLDDALVVKVVFSSMLPPQYKLNEQYLSDLLSEYKRASHGKIRVEYLDPGASPKGREEAISVGVSPVQLDVRARDRREVKECFMGVAFLYGDKRDAIGVIQDTENLEYEITARIKKLLNPDLPLVGLVKNGEAATISSKSMETLMAPLYQLYRLQEIDLSKTVPSDVKALWMIGPTKPIEPEALVNLRSYMNEGGVFGLLLDRNAVKISEFRASPQPTGFDSFLAEWGLKMRDGLVVDPRCDRIQIQAVQGAFRMINVVDYPYFPWVSDLDRNNPATKGLDGICLPFVSPIEITDKKAGFSYTPLARSSQFSFLDDSPSFLNPLQPKSQSANAVSGPFNLGLLVEGASGSGKKTRFILFGTSHFIDSDYPARPTNYSLFINLIDWSVQDDVLIQIRSKGFARRPLKEFSDGIRLIYKYLMIIALPMLSLVLGLVVWRRQKIRRALLPLAYTAG